MAFNDLIIKNEYKESIAIKDIIFMEVNIFMI